MMEHIFRNINDIRIFDILTEFVVDNDSKIEEKDAIEIDEIMDMLEYNEYKRVEVEDSVEHLLRNDILGIFKVETEGKTGCKICKWADKLGLPRTGEHIKHIPERVDKGEINNYYMKNNHVTALLRSAVFGHAFAMAEKEEKEEKLQKEKIQKELEGGLNV